MESKLEIIDWELGAKLAGNKPEVADEILGMMIKDLPEEINKIKYLYKTKNFVQLRNHVHKLHGALCYCGLPRLKNLVNHLETTLKNNIMSDLPFLMSQLDTEVNLILEYYPLHRI